MYRELEGLFMALFISIYQDGSLIVSRCHPSIRDFV